MHSGLVVESVKLKANAVLSEEQLVLAKNSEGQSETVVVEAAKEADQSSRRAKG